MAESENTATVPSEVYRGTMRSMMRCSIITPETQYQGGLRYADPDADGPRRLFFGEQTEEDELKSFIGAQIAGVAVPVEVQGYFRYRTNAYGEDYLDESALFVKRVTIAG